MSLVGKTLGNYEITGLLGEGGFATVYEGQHKTLGHKVAIKALHTTLGSHDDIRARFRSEARILAHLDHPGIVRAVDFYEDDETCAFVLDYLDGQPLDEILNDPPGWWRLDLGVNLSVEVLDALHYAHTRPEPIIHRDIKPSNLFVKIGERGIEARVMDFGVARILGSDKRRTRTGTVIGSLHYMSPEQIEGARDIDARTDVYSMGIVLYEIATGRVPFDADSDFHVMQAHLQEPPPEPRVLNPRLSASFEAVILKALAKDRDERFASAAAFRAKLVEATAELSSEEMPVRPQPGPEPVQPPSSATFAETSSKPRVPTIVERPPTRVEEELVSPPVPQQASPLNKASPGFALIALAVTAGVVLIGGFGAGLGLVLLSDKGDDTGADQDKSASVRGTVAEQPDKVAKPSNSTEVPDAVQVDIPAGPFTMGCRGGKTCRKDARPSHTVHLDAFAIDKTEVTNAAYRRCVEAKACTTPTIEGCVVLSGGGEKSIGVLPPLFNAPRAPVVCVTWQQAVDHCTWAKGRLPSEAEWEKAARGTDGRTFPWGEVPPDCSRASMKEGLGGCGRGATSPVGERSKGASPYGVLDMAGNVWEWTADWHHKGTYSKADRRNPVGPPSGTKRVARGGAFLAPGTWGMLETTIRNPAAPDEPLSPLGFRCAYDR